MRRFYSLCQFLMPIFKYWIIPKEMTKKKYAPKHIHFDKPKRQSSLQIKFSMTVERLSRYFWFCAASEVFCLSTRNQSSNKQLKSNYGSRHQFVICFIVNHVELKSGKLLGDCRYHRSISLQTNKKLCHEKWTRNN